MVNCELGNSFPQLKRLQGFASRLDTPVSNQASDTLQILPFGKRFFLLCPPIIPEGTLLSLTLLLLASKIQNGAVKLASRLKHPWEVNEGEREGALQLHFLRTGSTALATTLPTQNCQKTQKIKM